MRLLFISLVSFVVVATLTSAFNSWRVSYKPKEQVKEVAEIKEQEFVIKPILSENETFPIVSAQAVLAEDIETGTLLYEKNPDEAFLPASTTKILTALVAMDYYSDDGVLQVKEVKVEGQKMGLVVGEKIRAEDLFYGLLVFSANDAAEVLAQNYPGGREVFITLMNLKANELGLINSNFTNPTGLDTNGDKVYSTAKDLIKISKFAMENPRFAKIVGTKSITVRSLDGKLAHRLVNINELLGTVEGVLGVKTGWTENARENLVTYVVRGDKKVMIALLGSQDRFGETRELIDWVFANYNWVRVPKDYSSSPP